VLYAIYSGLDSELRLTLTVTEKQTRHAPASWLVGAPPPQPSPESIVDVRHPTSSEQFEMALSSLVVGVVVAHWQSKLALLLTSA